MTTPTMKEILRVSASDREDAMTTTTPVIKALDLASLQATESPAAFLMGKIEELQRDLAAREAELAAMKERAEKFRWQVIDTCKRAEAAERELESVKAENSKLRSALEIVHFKREPWQ